MDGWMDVLSGNCFLPSVQRKCVVGGLLPQSLAIGEENHKKFVKEARDAFLLFVSLCHVHLATPVSSWTQ